MTEMVPVLEKLKVWTLYVHIVAQVNHMGLGVKVETNCLRDGDLIPRHSFLSTTFSIFVNGVLKFMRVFEWSLVADKTNFSSKLSKCKQSNSLLKVSDDSGDALVERYISFKTKTYCHFCLIVQASLI